MPPTERSGAGGRTPQPGRGGGRGPATASSVKVDTTDIEKLKRLLGDSAKEAEHLSTALTQMSGGPTSAIGKLNTEVQQLRAGLGRAGTGSGRSTSTQSGNAGAKQAANQHAGQISGTEAIGAGNGGSSYLTGHWTAGLSRPSAAVGYLAEQAMTGGVNLMAGHLQDATGRSYLLNRWSLVTGAGMGYGSQMNLGRGLAGMFGNNTLGYADTTQAAGALMATGAVSGRLGQSRVASAAFGAALNPTQGAMGGAAMTSRVFTPQNYYRARLAGINTMAGGRQNLQSFMDSVIDRYESTAGHKLTAPEIQSGNQPGMPLYLTLVNLGFADDGDRQNLLTYWSARNRTGKTGTAALAAAGANTGLFRQAQQTVNARGQALSQADVGGMRGMERGLRGKQLEYQALGGLADTPFGHVVMDATGTLSAFNSELKLVNKTIQLMIGGSILKRLVGGGGGVAGAAGEASILGRLDGIAGRGGKLGMLGRFGGAALRGGGMALAGELVGSGIDAVGNATGHHHAGTILGDAARGAGIGAAVGTFIPIPGVGTATGAAVGAGVGAAWGARHDIAHGVSSAWNWATGDSDRNNPPQGDSGPTWQQLESIAKHGPPHIATSTTTGQHATNSYHYKGQAVDFAAPGGGVDSPGLLAINKFWAARYGRKLKELIYAGPGGVCIKDGKVVNGMAFYGAATMAEHHNHVHVAATPASLAGAGGGVSVGSSSGNNRGSDTVGASPASSSGGFGGSLLGTLFSASSGGSLLAALSTQGGGASYTGFAASGGGGGGGRSGAGGGGHIGSAPTDVHGAVALGRRMAASRGWTGRQWDALYKLWQNESGWDPTARNSSSGAAGIPQDITGNMHGGAAGQIKWGMNYIAGRYHDPVHALQFWNRTDSRPYPGHWYEGGKWELIRDEIAQLHKGEMVVPATTAEKLRQAVGAPSQGSSDSGGRAAGGRRIPVQLVFMVQRGTDAEMRQAARKFAEYVEEDHDIQLVASR